MSERNFEALAAKLKDAETDAKTKCAIVTELRDGIDQICQLPSFPEFLSTFVPVLLELLDGPPVFSSTSVDQRLRHTALDVFYRIPNNVAPAAEPHAAQIVDKCMQLVRVENEDNAILCLKIVMDLERFHTKVLADRVQPFLELIIELFDGIEQIVKDTFESGNEQAETKPLPPATPALHAPSPHPGSPSGPSVVPVSSEASSDSQNDQLPKGTSSLKVFAECPIIVVSIFQAYRTLVGKVIKSIIPRVRTIVLLQATSQRKAHAEATARGDTFCVMSRDIAIHPHKRAVFGDLIMAQIKTLSFLAYLLRIFAGSVDEFIDILPDLVIRLLQDCPKDKPVARKELLVAMRHILNFKFRNIFLPYLDHLLDDRTLLGDALTVHEQSRSLAYTTLADLIHHVRESLSRDQIHKTVVVYSKNLRDDNCPNAFATMSAKLLFNMAESIANLPDKRDGRHLIMMVLDAASDKLESLNRCYKNNLKAIALARERGEQVTLDAINYLPDKDKPPTWDEIDIYRATPVETLANRLASDNQEINPKFIFRNLITGLKSILYQLRATNPVSVREEMDPSNVPATWSEVAYGFSSNEVDTLVRLFHEGAQVFRYYDPDKVPEDPSTHTPVETLANQHMMTSGKDEKDLLEAFAGAFHHIDPSTFYEVFQAEIPHLHDMIHDHAALLHIPQFLLASEATSPAFCGLLLQFLMGKLELVGAADMQKSSVILRLFKLSFMAVTLFSAQNESVLLPHVTTLITKSIELSITAEEPMNYFLLLRSLFRSIGGGRFERLYKEILPLLEMLLEVLNNLLISARKPHERDLFVELSLTVPARLSHLLPHLSYLMRPLVVALRAGSELIAQGLRTLELCVDNLTADYLDPIMAPVINDLMAALWNHLRPQPYSHFHSHTTLRILGKLGGRNRKFLTAPPTLEYRTFADDETSYDIRLTGSNRDRAFPSRIGCDSAIQHLVHSSRTIAGKDNHAYYKQQALRLIISQTQMLIGADHMPVDFAQIARLQADEFWTKRNMPDAPKTSDSHKTTAKLVDQRATLLKLLKALMVAASIPETRDEARQFLCGIHRHFTLLEFGAAHAREGRQAGTLEDIDTPLTIHIDSKVMADAITESLSSDHAIVREQAGTAITEIWQSASTIFGDAHKAESLPFFTSLLKISIHSCYEEDWFVKSGGVEGINIILDQLAVSDEWLAGHQLELVGALLFVMKDMPQDLPATVRNRANEALQLVVRRCNKDQSPEDLTTNTTPLYKVTSKLIMDLSHMNKHVRLATQEAFKTVAEVIGLELCDLVSNVKELVLMTLFNKPLRALPFAVSIGYIDALIFFLEMENGVLEYDDRLKKALLETLALVEAEDDQLTPKPTEYRSAESIINLRVACLRLLTIAIRLPGYNDPKHRARTIAVFFRSLYSKNSAVGQAANAGLKIVLGVTQKLPKDLLQTGLRPILMNVQDPRKLSVEGLEGLRTLLQLLTNYFKVEIGARLLDHMKIIADVPSLQRISFSLIEQDQTIMKCTAILSVFHLLPTQAAQFLGALVERVLQLERHLRRCRSSPFREPLIRYLNNYTTEAWAYFSTNLKDEAKGLFFAQLLTDERAGPLRAKIIEGDGFSSALKSITGSSDLLRANVNAIHIGHALSITADTRSWLVNNAPARHALYDAAISVEKRRFTKDVPSELRTPIEQIAHQTLVIFITYLQQALGDLDFMFDLFKACVEEKLRFAPCLYAFIYEHIITSEDVDYRRRVATKCIDLYTNQEVSAHEKEFLFHNVLNPMFASDVQRNWESLIVKEEKGTALVDQNMIALITNKLWKPQTHADIFDDPSIARADFCRMELIQLTCLLLKYHPALLFEQKKEVIKFGWLYLRLEDAINKYGSYCLISYFIAQFEAPSKLVVQVYGKLLGASQPEGRHLVMQALEIMEPVLIKRIGDNNPRMSTWSRVPRKILSEESSNVQQLVCIYQFLVKHPDTFYEARESFTATIIPSLTKVCSLPNPTPDQRQLALSLFNTIWTWEKTSITNLRSAKGLAPNQQLELESDHAWVATYQHRLMLIKFMIQFIASMTEIFPVQTIVATDETPAPAKTVTKAVALLHSLLSGECWTDIEIDHMFPKVTEQILLSEPKSNAEGRIDPIWNTRIVNTLQIVRVFLHVRDNDFVLNRAEQLQRMLAKHLKSDKLDVQACLFEPCSAPGFPELKGIIPRFVEAVPTADGDDEAMPDADNVPLAFVTSLSTLAGELLSSGDYFPAVNILWTLSQRDSKLLDTHLPAIMKCLQNKLAKPHLAEQAPNGAQSGQQSAQVDPQESELTVALTMKCVKMVATRISLLNDLRRPYLSALASLLEKSSSQKLCKCVMDMCNDWIFHSTEPVPTIKEKVAVLQKLISYEFRTDTPLYHDFLDMVARIYETPKVVRSELAVRMENAFLLGLRCQDVKMRARFKSIFDRSLSRTMTSRFYKLIGDQHWDALADSYWIVQLNDLLFGAVEMNTPAHLHPDDYQTMPLSLYCKGVDRESRSDVMLDDGLETLVTHERQFLQDLADIKTRDVLEPIVNLQHVDNELAHEIWIAIFPMCWSALSREDRDEVEGSLISLLTKDNHNRQADRRPNCVATMLEGIVRVKPTMKFPPHAMKFQAKNFGAWYTAATYIERIALNPVVETAAVRESTLDSLVELYASLQENDLFYGTWRRRCQFVETNAALSYEQNGAWEKAQHMYEQAQIKARTGSLAFSQGEYMLWEDHWVHCAEKMQQWEILADFAKHESLNDLFLEATWRNYEAWTGAENHAQLETIIQAVSDAPTPRRLFFSAFMSLLKLHGKTESQQDFNRACDENIQLSIRQWHKLPKDITQAHITLLQNFQNIVELHDASVMCNSLSQTNAGNLAERSQDLKLMLGTWRDRLPNFWDDINAWQDLVTWRQHVFHIINGVYLTLVPSGQNNSSNQSYAYRGYHETAWIINRFAHVARKHQMPDVCINQLSRIYTLPNIEIQEAFLKLREQAKCHYQNRSELTSGLDVINNTNLNYFGQQQKAEFYTLKGMFLAKLNHKDEASDAFGTALFFDIKLPKAWAEWGRYNDLLFKEDPTDIEKASSAMSCYLEAAGQYKSAKSRKILSRILWLLSLDDANGTLAKSFNAFKGESPTWYWITFIPQLLNNLSRTPQEAQIARDLLGKLAKLYPQALYFQLRTSREDMMTIKKAEAMKALKEERARAAKSPTTNQEKVATHVVAQPSSAATTPVVAEMTSTPAAQVAPAVQAPQAPQVPQVAAPSSEIATKVETPKTDIKPPVAANADATTPAAPAPPAQAEGVVPMEIDTEENIKPKKPWDHTDELIQSLRTAFPLLFVSMELMVDQIQKFTKHQHDEDAYRLTVALLNDALSYIGRYTSSYAPGVSLPTSTEANITRFAETLVPTHLREAFEADFVSRKPTMLEYITNLRKWRNRFQELLERRPQTLCLEQASHLSEFRYMKFDEVEIPGQYLQHRDKNQDFTRIERFLPNVDLVRSVNACYRRLRIRGHDGSVHAFAIQHPAARNSRREERVLQLFRSFNSTLEKKKESRRRNLQFNLPVMIPLSPTVRMVEDDASYISLQAIYEDHVRRHGGDKDEPILFTIEKLRGLSSLKPEFAAMKLETFMAVQDKFVPATIASDYFAAIYPTFDALWLFRKHFSSQLAALTFLTFTMHMTQRYPAKMNIARSSGKVWGQELVPTMANAKPMFSQPEAVPFRLTPNLQMLMGPIHTEGIFVCALQAIARCLTDVSTSSGSAASTPNPDKTTDNGTTSDAANGNANGSTSTSTASDASQFADLEGQLSMFIRDEMSFWYTQQHRQTVKDNELRENVQQNADAIVNKAVVIADGPRAGNLPASQSVLDLISRATEPKNLCMTDPLWMPWL